MNNKGQSALFSGVYFTIIAFIVAACLIGGFWIVSTIAPIMVGEGQNLVGQVQSGISSNNAPNSSIVNATTTAANLGYSFLGIAEGIIYMLMLGLLGGFIAVCYYARTYRFLAFAWVGLMIGLIFMSIIVSNAYQQAATSSPDLAAFYNLWGTNNFLMLYLPYIVGVLTVISGIILFAIVSTDSEEENRTV